MLRFYLATALAITAGYFGFQQWTAHVLRHQTTRQELTIEKALTSKDPSSALPYLAKLPPLPVTASAEERQKRLDLLVRGYTIARDFPKLLNLYRSNPAAILANQAASILLARHFLAFGQARDVAILRSPWQNTAQGRDAWLLFDADALLGKGLRDEATALLKGTTLVGSDEALRHVRLALLAPKGTDYTAAWNELAIAEKTDTRNADVRAFRAQLLELAGKPTLARIEYLAAVLAEPQNPLWVEQLAEFYRRSGQLDLTLDTLTEGEATFALDTLAVKASFWSRMLRSSAIQTKANHPTTANEARNSGTALASVATYIRLHPQWSEVEARSLVDIEKLQATRQEILWLRVLAALQKGQEKQAFELLQTHHHKTNSLNPLLENALLCTLSWRLDQQLSPLSLKLASIPTATSKTNSLELSADHTLHPFFRELDAARQAQHAHPGTAPAPALRHLLESPHAFASAFLAAGWRQAALTLEPKDALPADAPLWLSYGIAQCLSANEGPQASLDFITHLPAALTTAYELKLLTAENQMALGQTSSAQAQLTALATNNNDVGYRASWLLAGLYLQQQQPVAAEQVVQHCPTLSQAPLGKELLATAALARHDEAKAQQIYQGIASTSVQARTYLARQAFTAKDYTTAERLTQELITLMPDKLQLRANLVTILNAKGKAPRPDQPSQAL